VTFADLNGDATVDQTEILQTNHYYPFGMRHEGNDAPQQGTMNAYQYNGIERCEDFGLSLDLAEVRSYDASIGRWHQIDPKSSERESVYVGFANNPILYSDPFGDTAIVELPTIVVYAEPIVYDQTPVRYGYNGTFSEWKQQYGINRNWSYKQAITHWNHVESENFNAWVEQQDKEEAQREAVEKLTFFLYPFYITEDVALVYPFVPVFGLAGAGTNSAIRTFQLRLAATGGREAAKEVGDLLKAGNALNKGGLTAVGRALQKHGSRTGSIFPQATGNAAAINAQGEAVLNEILTNPAVTKTVRYHARFGNVLEYRIPGGQGARFSGDGKTFIGFLE
jgi:RHS repeat-associated protein